MHIQEQLVLIPLVRIKITGVPESSATTHVSLDTKPVSYVHLKIYEFNTSTQLVKPDRCEAGPTALRASPDYQLLCELVQHTQTGFLYLELE
ncbi:hypothetical protein F511_31587 [Dorcoceras hygrometricum]|uniref:Uncharacterized protein n=1 Tax=Dorcoceras hygrometricum TaxID=472368 RepID=A0A2Z7AFG9_9LAMI|nr:hypothetical protein F511_31587 [Dorcoceras hygrometricum]